MIIKSISTVLIVMPFLELLFWYTILIMFANNYNPVVIS